MQRSDLLSANAQIFKGQGKALNDYADKDVKVVVVGNPANTNAMITAKFAPSIPKENFTALTRLDVNRAIAQIAHKCNVGVHQVNNIVLWGNHSLTQYPDVNHGFIELKGKQVPINAAVNDDKWIKGDYCKDVAKRGAAIIEARKLSSAASAANAVCDHVHDWFVGTEKGQIASMGVISSGEYGIPAGINFSFPVTCQSGKWKIVEGLNISDTYSQEKIKKTA